MSRYPESIDRITRARLAASAVGSVLSIALTMFFVGVLVFLAFFSTKFIQNLSSKMEMEVLFYSEESGVKEADIIAFEQTLKLQPYVATSRVSSQADNVAEAKRVIGNNYEEVIPNPINASIILTLKEEYTQNADSLNTVVKAIKENKIVQDVEYPEYIVDLIQGNFNKIQWITLGFCAVFMFISLLLIANSLRLNIYAQRFNIRSMLLIGATRSFVRKPFIIKGLAQGAWAGFIAVVLVAAALWGGYVALPEIFDLSYTQEISIILGGLFLFSILFTMLAAFLFVNKYIKINSDRLYL